MTIDPSFDTLSLLMLAGAAYTLVLLRRRGRAFWTGDLRGEDRALAVQVALFLLTPPVVLLHELGHAAVTILLGGRVVQLHYVGFSGYVVPAGFFTPAGIWLIAVAGSAVSLAVSVAYLVVGARAAALPKTVRYVLLTSGALNGAFTLAGYPALSLLGRFGDWLTIYDFRATPALAGGTVVAHVAISLGLLQWWRRSLQPTLSEWDGSHVDALDAGEPTDPDYEARRLMVEAFMWLGRMRPNKAVPLLERAASLTANADADPELAQRILANLFLGLTNDHRATEAEAVFGRLNSEWRNHPGVQSALDIIEVRTGRRLG